MHALDIKTIYPHEINISSYIVASLLCKFQLNQLQNPTVLTRISKDVMLRLAFGKCVKDA
jgi:hypothetical protein